MEIALEFVIGLYLGFGLIFYVLGIFALSKYLSS